MHLGSASDMAAISAGDNAAWKFLKAKLRSVRQAPALVPSYLAHPGYNAQGLLQVWLQEGQYGKPFCSFVVLLRTNQDPQSLGFRVLGYLGLGVYGGFWEIPQSCGSTAWRRSSMTAICMFVA